MSILNCASSSRRVDPCVRVRTRTNQRSHEHRTIQNTQTKAELKNYLPPKVPKISCNAFVVMIMCVRRFGCFSKHTDTTQRAQLHYISMWLTLNSRECLSWISVRLLQLSGWFSEDLNPISASIITWYSNTRTHTLGWLSPTSNIRSNNK